MLLKEKKFVATNAVQIEGARAKCTKGGMDDCAMRVNCEGYWSCPMRVVAAQAPQPIYFWFVPSNFLPVRSAVS